MQSYLGRSFRSAHGRGLLQCLIRRGFVSPHSVRNSTNKELLKSLGEALDTKLNENDALKNVLGFEEKVDTKGKKKTPPRKKYIPPGHERIPGTIERIPQPEKPRTSKGRPAQGSDKKAPGINPNLINFEGADNNDFVFKSHEDFIIWAELNLSFEIRELVYLTIEQFQAKVKENMYRSVHPKFKEMLNSMKEKIISFTQRREGDSVLKYNIDKLDFQKFPNRERISEIRQSLYSEKHDTGFDKAQLCFAQSEYFNAKLIESERSYINKEENENTNLRIYDIFKHNVSQHFQQPEDFAKSNWIYVYGLPYEFDENEILNKLKTALLLGDSVKSVYVSQFKDCMEQRTLDDQVYKSRNPEIERQNLDKVMKAQGSTANVNKMIRSMEASIKKEGSKKEIHLGKEPSAFAEKMAREGNHIYDKSYILLEFKDRESKESILNSDLRVFGLGMDANTLKFEDADFKHSLKMFNVPIGMTTHEFLTEINEVLEKAGVPLFDLEAMNASKVITYPSLCLTFSNFQNSFMAIKALNNMVIRNKVIRVAHNYGGVYFMDGRFLEIQQAMMRTVIKERANETIVAMKQFSSKSDFTMHKTASEYTIDLNNLMF